MKLRLLAALALPAMLAGSCAEPTGATMPQADPRQGELSAKPRQSEPGATTFERGLIGLDVGLPRRALLYVPESVSGDRPAPLILVLHGAGGQAAHSIELGRAHADRLGAVLLAPASRAASWDIISERGFGSDVQAIDAALERIFSAYPIDPKRVAISGFSDGASYALSLGLTNGDLFSHVLAFAPGFMVPTRQHGRPRIFISHGVADRVLPIDRCSRRIVPQLRRAAYTVYYREFPDGHTVPPEIAQDAFAMLAADGEPASVQPI